MDGLAVALQEIVARITIGGEALCTQPAPNVGGTVRWDEAFELQINNPYS